MTRLEHHIVESSYLLVAAECGWLALGAYMLWLLYYLFKSWRLLRPLANTNYFYIPCGLVGGLTACYLQTCLEWVLRQAVNFIVLMMLFAMVAYLQDAMKRHRPPAGLAKRRGRRTDQAAGITAGAMANIPVEKRCV